MFQNSIKLKNKLLQLIGYRLLSTKNHFDVIITGGGMVGTTLACALGQNPHLNDKKILLLEAEKPKTWNLEKYSNRVSALNCGTRRLLTQIGAWTHIEQARFGPVWKMQVWDGVSDAMISFGGEKSGQPVAYIVENDLIVHGVGQVLAGCPNVHVVYEAKVKSYTLPGHEKELVEVTLEDGSKITSNLLLGCDGANSQVRKAMQVNYVTWSYQQMGVVATLHLEPGDNDVAFQRFLPDGPVAILPLNSAMSSLVWSTTPARAKKLLEMPEHTFIEQLNQALWKPSDKSLIVENVTRTFDEFSRIVGLPSDKQRVFPAKIVGVEGESRAAFPLGFGHACNYLSKNVVLVGDAAHRVHPLAGQGVNLGFGDVECLNRILGETAYSGSPLENLAYLKDYESERQRHNVPIMLMMEGLHRLYTTDFTPLVLLRSLGLQGIHSLSPLKKLIVQAAQ